MLADMLTPERLTAHLVSDCHARISHWNKNRMPEPFCLSTVLLLNIAYPDGVGKGDSDLLLALDILAALRRARAF